MKTIIPSIWPGQAAALGIQFSGGLAWLVYPFLVQWEGMGVGGGFPSQERSLLPSPPAQPEPTVLPEPGDVRPRRGCEPAAPAPPWREAGTDPRSLVCWKRDLRFGSFLLGHSGHKSNYGSPDSKQPAGPEREGAIEAPGLLAGGAHARVTPRRPLRGVGGRVRQKVLNSSGH